MSFLPEISNFYQLIFKALAEEPKTKFDFDISLLVAILAAGFSNFWIMCISLQSTGRAFLVSNESKNMRYMYSSNSPGSVYSRLKIETRGLLKK